MYPLCTDEEPRHTTAEEQQQTPASRCYYAAMAPSQAWRSRVYDEMLSAKNELLKKKETHPFARYWWSFHLPQTITSLISATKGYFIKKRIRKIEKEMRIKMCLCYNLESMHESGEILLPEMNNRCVSPLGFYVATANDLTGSNPKDNITLSDTYSDDDTTARMRTIARQSSVIIDETLKTNRKEENGVICRRIIEALDKRGHIKIKTPSPK